MDDPDGLFKDLEKEYCPPLDPALFTAIVTDFDLADSSQVQQLRDTLDALKLSAWEQEDLPFDPSGTSGLGTTNGLDVDRNPSEPSVSQNGTVRSRETDITSLASDFSSVNVSGRSAVSDRVSYVRNTDGSFCLSGATDKDKIEYLAEMFPSADPFTIQHTLTKSVGDVDRAMDVLLNVVFFNEQPVDEDSESLVIPKGVDGFEGGLGGKASRKKGKRKTKNNHRSKENSPLGSDSGSPLLEEPRTVNKWDAAQKDVDFIHSCTSAILKKEAVKSAYHANGASLPATIRSLAGAYAPKEERDIENDPVTMTQVAELTQEFPSVAAITSAGLLHITRGSVSAASELAAAMVTAPATPTLSEVITFQAPPIIADEREEKVPKRGTAASRVAQSYEGAQGSAGAHFAASAEALSKASAAYRRGKSDRYMGGAAAYYAAVGRDHLERAKRDSAAASDALVDLQSTSTVLDLHGVSVQDAVRIASERVSLWWESLGDARYKRGGGGPVGGGYRIVTGVGRHSHDGTSRLGPAVGKMLAREGWRVAVDQGFLTVVGVVRSR